VGAIPLSRENGIQVIGAVLLGPHLQFQTLRSAGRDPSSPTTSVSIVADEKEFGGFSKH
jgi:hypothetical protein